MTAHAADLRGEMVALGRRLEEKIVAGDEETRRALRQEIRDGNKDNRRYMRVLHEDLVERLGLLFEGRDPRLRPAPEPPPR